MRQWRISVLLVFVLAFAATATGALAQKPAKEAYAVELEFAAGEVCAFPVHVESAGQKLMTLPSGRQMITGTGKTTVTNRVTGRSIGFRESGSLTTTELSESELRFDIAGHVSLYFFEQDVEGAGLRLVTGRVREVLDLEQDAITALEITGRQKDLCAALAS